MLLKNAKQAAKFIDFTVKSIGLKDAGAECIVEGYANTSTKDRVGDVVMPKAFEKSLPTYLKNPILLENHNWEKVAGKCLSAEITDKGLYIKARISDTREDLKTLIREGALSTFSIGYNEIDADYDEATKTKFIKDLELLEISVVSVPANTEASFTVVDTKKPDAPAGDDQKADAEAPKCEKCGEAMKDGKCEKCSEPAKSVTAQDLKSFIEAVKEAGGDEVSVEDVIELSDFYVTEGNNMKLNRKQLIEALRASIKSAQAPAAAAAPAEKPDAGKADAPTDQAKPEGDPMKELSAKLDAIAQACAQILEGMKGEEDAEGDKPADEKPEGDKPADEGKDAPAAAPADGEKALEDMNDDELAALEAEIDEQISDLEDSE